MKAYVFILAMLLTWCLAISCIKYQFHHAGPGIFFYHELVSDLGQHAIQFSILVFAGMIFLLQEITHNRYLINRRIHLLLLTYLIGGILLLSSKLVISFTLCCLAYYAFISLKKNIDTRKAIALVAMVAIGISCMVLFTKNPVGNRFADIMHDNLSVLHQKKFNQGVYFNGVQFRLLQWRFVKEIIQEHHAWLLGVTPANAQPLLDQKYMEADMYAGTPGTSNDHGYLVYNTHNQFLESFLQSGLIGLIIFTGICCSMIIMAFQQKSRMLWAVVLLLLAYCFSESVLETQYGLIVFLFLPLFFAPHPLKGENTAASLSADFQRPSPAPL
jgi:O-antigen ligase